MKEKRIILFIVIALILTGCTKISDNLDDVVDATMNTSSTAVNTVSTGYELYVPIGVKQVADSDYNQKFKIRNQYVYLYVDTVSYYYKNTLNYKSEENYSYYFKQLNFNDKTGYIGINKLENDEYFCEIVYNYSKIEFYVNSEDLKFVLTNSLIIQNSIKFNDNLIAIELESKLDDGREIKYQLDKPSNTESTFSQYLQEYVTEDDSQVELPDED